MGTNRKDVYSGMVAGPIGGFGKITREKEIVSSPMRSKPTKKRRIAKKPKELVEKSLANKMLMQKSFERSFEKRLASIDDDTLDVLFPEDNDDAIDTFVSGLNEKWLFDGIGGYIRRALKNKRRSNRTGKKTLNDGNLSEKGAEKPRLRDPKGGLTAAGRAHFKRTEGSNLKPGVKGAADTPGKMRRKGSFLTRFFTNPSGPMVGDNGKPTRLALSAAAWGEPVPKNRSDAAKLAAKGQRLLERYKNTKKKK